MDQLLEKLSSPVVLACIALTVLGCLWISIKSFTNAKKNIVDSGAQHATTVGVTFTFIGIIYALLDFNVKDISGSIPAFLDGMKTAFITSIIGIAFSLFISRFIQKDAIERSKNELQGQFQNISTNSNGILDALNDLKKSLDANNSQQNIISNKLAMIEKSSAATANITGAINGLKESIEKSSSGVLERAIGNLSNTMNQFIYANEDSQRTLQNVAEQLIYQNKAIQALGKTLQQSSENQIQAIDLLGQTLQNSSDKQVDSIDLLGQTLKTSIEDQVGAINLLGQTLQNSSEKQTGAINSLGVELRTSGDEQISRLDKMNETITQMKNFSQKSYENSVTLLDSSKTC